MRPAESVHVPHIFPKRANYFLKWSLTEIEARELAKWDVLILDMETQVTSRPLLRKLREWNPKIILLAYIASEEIATDALRSPSALRRQLASQIPDAWYAADASGSRLSFWPGTHLLNAADNCPLSGGQRFNQYLPRFVNDTILSTGLWDGIFYDNALDSITSFGGDSIDLDRDRIRDTAPDLHWQTGMKFLYNETRRLSRNNIILVGNGTTRLYRGELNGNMIENFLPVSWGPTMRTYAYNQTRTHEPALNIINANTNNNGGSANYRQMRFGLSSSLLEDGYYSFDYGDRDHAQLWWYDEYGIDLGRPIGKSRAYRTVQTEYAPDIWQREFEHGLAIVNSTNAVQTIRLDGEYERIHGVQDPVVNNGAIIDEATVPANDGLIVLKTMSTLLDTPYPNGVFVRFFHPDGTRARNGFFAFDGRFAGGDRIASIDLTGNGARDLLVISKNKITATRDDGQPLFRIYPYTANYGGQLFFTLGQLTKASGQELLVYGDSGKRTPLKIYSAYGESLKKDWLSGEYKTFSSAYSVTTVQTPQARFLVGVSSVGEPPWVSVYTPAYERINRWLAYDKNFRGGIYVTAGDMEGDGSEEIIVAPMTGEPRIKIFNTSGQEVYPSFSVSSKISGLAVVDADFDHRDEIVVFGAAPGL